MGEPGERKINIHLMNIFSSLCFCLPVRKIVVYTFSFPHPFASFGKKTIFKYTFFYKLMGSCRKVIQ